eukprot:3940671-Rhodomonas_salina.1
MLLSAYVRSGTDIACAAMLPRPCYAMSGTDIAYGVMLLRACYAMSSTDIWCYQEMKAGRYYHPPMILRDVRANLQHRGTASRTAYVMSYISTGLSSILYLCPKNCAVLSQRMVRGLWRVCVCGTELAYGPTVYGPRSLACLWRDVGILELAPRAGPLSSYETPMPSPVLTYRMLYPPTKLLCHL